MIRFTDGPAKDLVLELARVPIVLRVTKSAEGWDALDQIDDVPRDDESIFVYRLEGSIGSMHVCCSPRSQSRWCRTAEYRLLSFQPPDPVVRSKARWQEWCEQFRPTIMREAGRDESGKLIQRENPPCPQS